MKKNNFKKGRLGEKVARLFLEKKGYVWMESNYSMKGGEIDLVMTNDDFLIFVEVKLKTGDDFGNPEEMINKNKIANIKRVAQLFLMEKTNLTKKYEKYRIDAVCIQTDKNKKVEEIRHYENIDG